MWNPALFLFSVRTSVPGAAPFRVAQDSGGVRAAGLPAAVVALAEKMQCAAWAFAPRCIGHLSALRLPLHRTAWDSSF